MTHLGEAHPDDCAVKDLSTETLRLNDHFPHRGFPQRLEDNRDPGKEKKKLQ